MKTLRRKAHINADEICRRGGIFAAQYFALRNSLFLQKIFDGRGKYGNSYEKMGYTTDVPVMTVFFS